MRSCTVLATALGPLFAVALLMLPGCGAKRVEAPPAPVSAWGADESSEIAAELMDAALAHPWSSQFHDRNGRAPVVRVGEIDDRSGDSVPLDEFARELAKRLAASEKVKLGDQPDFVLGGIIAMKPGNRDGKPVKYFQVDLRFTASQGDDTAWTFGIERAVADEPAPVESAVPR